MEPGATAPPDRFEYRLSLELDPGARSPSIPLLALKPHGVGDVIDLPIRADGLLLPGEHHDWRVTDVRPARTGVETLFLAPTR